MVEPPRLPLVLLPTPVHPLPRLSRELGIDLWIKRDDLTGLALGGNKGRKLEYLMADALLKGCDTIVTCGSLQSNFVRQLGACCAMHQIACHAVVMPLPYNDAPILAAGDVPHEGGNVILDRWLGVELHRVPDAPWDALFAQAEALADDLEAAGRKVYRIPVGGSSWLGAYAFYQAGLELAKQGEFHTVVCPTSSGSTHGGLAAAAGHGGFRVLGVMCDPEPEFAQDLIELMAVVDRNSGLGAGLGPEDFVLRFDCVGQGYGVPSDEGQEAIARLARTEGIFLDPIYSAKAFAGLLKFAQEGLLSGRTVFWHTGGTPALFATATDQT